MSRTLPGLLVVAACGAVAGLAAPGRAAAGEVELSHAEDVLTDGQPGWRETALRVDWTARDRPGLAAQASRVERFDRVDAAFSAAASAPLGERWVLAVEGGGSATHHVLPALTAGARAQWAPGGGLVAVAAGRFSRFRAVSGTTDVALGSLGIERYLGTFRVSGTGFAATVSGTWGLSGALAADVYFRERDRAGLVLSAGRELESLGGGRVLVTGVRAVALAGRSALGRSPWSVSWGAGVQRQGRLYTRTGGHLGLVREF
ncbi:MAG: YaiO family outer membrane beta-barrel protein [Anaeromyxobacteraceae bacterium]